MKDLTPPQRNQEIADILPHPPTSLLAKLPLQTSFRRYPAYRDPASDPFRDDCREPPPFVPICPESQPEWSAYRTPTYGFVHLSLKSATEAEW